MARERNYRVYIVASGLGGTLYIGVANDLVRRVHEHKIKAAEGFTKKYDVDRLVYFEQFDDIENAIRREKRLKKWNRTWKGALDRREQSELGRPLSFDCKAVITGCPAFAGHDSLVAIKVQAS